MLTAFHDSGFVPAGKGRRWTHWHLSYSLAGGDLTWREHSLYEALGRSLFPLLNHSIEPGDYEGFASHTSDIFSLKVPHRMLS